jgi:transcriptional regulator with XRE-family HTH domain
VEPPVHLGSVIRRLRIEKGLKIEDLAVAAGLSARSIQRIESGAQSPKNDVLSKICKALETRPSVVWEVYENGRAA